MSHNHDPIDNLSNNPHFQDILKDGLSGVNRRSILRGGVGLAALMGFPMLPGCATTTGLPSLPSSNLLGFTPVGKSLLDQVVVPAGYTVKVLHATGDTLDPAVASYSNT